MSYSYFNASSHRVQDNENYFLDANIWLKVLVPKNKQSHKDRSYSEFFDKLIGNTKVRIVVPALVLSEVINRIIREVHYEKYLKNVRKNQPETIIDASFYKNVYRNSQEYIIAYRLICDDIKSFSTSIDLINDEFGTTFKFKHILSDPPASLDFNDYYY